MTQTELIAMVRRGERIPRQRCSLHDCESDKGNHLHHWRVIVCDGEQDVCECLHCGKQSVFKCDFDEEYA
jgi:hypothetical protein